jgi:hypothetical protein
LKVLDFLRGQPDPLSLLDILTQLLDFFVQSPLNHRVRDHPALVIRVFVTPFIEVFDVFVLHNTFSLNPLGANLLKHVSHFQRNTPLLAGTLCDATLTRQD